MIRRPITEIELKVEDLEEWEAMRQSSAERAGAGAATQTTPSWDVGPKPPGEVHDRIGYAPKKKADLARPYGSLDQIKRLII